MGKTLVINARFLTQPITGVQRFAIEIALEIKKRIPEAQFVCPHNIMQHDIAAQLNAKVIGKHKGHLWEQFNLPHYLSKQDNSLLLNLCNTGPLFLSNQIVTIHDLAFLVNPKWFSVPFYIFYSLVIPKIAYKARHIITVSDSSKKEICERLNIKPERISVIHNAVSKEWLALTPEVPQTIKDINKYILCVSSIDPRKNLARLIEAYNLYENPDKLPLVIVGGENKVFSNESLRNLISENKNILFTGYVSDNELLWLYRNASLFVYPSLYEGFGIPPIEALYNNCPIAVSDISVLKEICKEYATYFDPYDINDIKEKISVALTDNEKINFSVDTYSWNESGRLISELIGRFI